jgi:hypothetical protein
MQDLVGTWRLVEWTFSVDGQRQRKPFGGDPVGLLTYTADGHMSATLMRRDRPQPDTTTLSAAPASERAQIAAGYVAYAGPYRLEGDTVVHRVEVSLFPNWVGGEQARRIEWVTNEAGGVDLELSTPPEPTDGGRTAVNRLRWRRVDNGDGGR